LRTKCEHAEADIEQFLVEYARDSEIPWDVFVHVIGVVHRRVCLEFVLAHKEPMASEPAREAL
jgi:hypothetical protein